MQKDSKYIGLLWSTPSPHLVVATPSKSDSCNNWAVSMDEELGHTSGQSCSRSVPPTLARCNGSGPVSRAGESSLWNTRRPSHCLSSTRSSSKHTYNHKHIYCPGTTMDHENLFDSPTRFSSNPYPNIF